MHSPHRHKHGIFLAVIVFVLSLVPSLHAETIKYTYDDLNRLCAVQYENNLVIQYGYDEVGNRKKKKVFQNPTPDQVPTCLVTAVVPAPMASAKSMKSKIADKKTISKTITQTQTQTQTKDSTDTNTNTNTNTVTDMAVKTYTIIGSKDTNIESSTTRIPRGDFNGDGQPDIFWRNNITGENKLWLMDGTTKVREITLESLTHANWEIAATGDFNRDGKIDIIWRNNLSGYNMIWLMDRATHTDTVHLSSVADINWTIAGVRDFNNDGYIDILWRNQANGENKIWLMNGTTVAEEVTLEAISVEWNIGK